MDRTFNNSVFINCPFDEGYKDIFYAILYAVFHCGFNPKCSLEEDNALNNRLSKIEHLIEQCKYGIHDLSRTETNSNSLPRFNMPFELGIFFGAKKFGDEEQKKKVALVLEREKYLYQQFISDLNGIDTKAHNNEIEKAIKIVRDWLKSASGRTTINGHLVIIKDYKIFSSQLLPKLVKREGLEINDLTFTDYCLIVEEALALNMD